MARGIGTTDGVATTDLILSALTGQTTLRSYAAWFWLTGAGGIGFGRLVGTQLDYLRYDSAGARLGYVRSFNGGVNPGQWSIAAPALAAWHHLLVTYDASAVGDVPIMYLDGVSQAVTTDALPVGIVDSNAALNLAIGNRDDGARFWNGRIADVGIWSDLRTSSDATLLASGGRVGDVSEVNLQEWVPMNENVTHSKVLADPTVTGTTIIDDPGPLHWELLTLQPMIPA